MVYILGLVHLDICMYAVLQQTDVQIDGPKHNASERVETDGQTDRQTKERI